MVLQLIIAKSLAGRRYEDIGGRLLFICFEGLYGMMSSAKMECIDWRWTLSVV